VEDDKRFQRAALFRRVPCISSSLLSLSSLFSLSILLSFFFQREAMDLVNGRRAVKNLCKARS